MKTAVTEKICDECLEAKATRSFTTTLTHDGKPVRDVVVHVCDDCDADDAAWSAVIYSAMKRLRRDPR